jgi:hypothetical protein
MVRTLRSVLLLFTSVLVLSATAQSGPGGVGNSANNVLWLSADHGVFSNAGTVPAASTANVQQWNDRSGNGRHATQTTTANRPNYHGNVINGQPVVRYTAANNDRMLSTGLASTSRASIWVIARHTALPSSNPGLLQGAASGNAYANPPADKNMGMWVSSSTSQVWGRGIQSDGTQRNVTMATALNSGQTYVLNTMYRAASIDQYVNHGAAGTVATNGTLRAWTDLAIGCQAGSESWNGDIAEVIVYNEAVNDAQRIIIANYLAAKYGLSLAANDVYREDDPARGNFDHDVAGIGRINASNQHTDAQGTGIIRISNPTGLNNNEFLMWGHNNGALGAWGVGDLPDGVEGRLERVWRVSERNTTGTAAVDVGAVDITFDLAGLGYVDPAHLRLIVDTDQDGVFADEAALVGATHLGGDRYRFSGVILLQDGVRFTLGTSNISVTSLPIELVSFQAQALSNSTVDISWATASEWDNDYFEVERSADLVTWTTVAQEDAVGHSNALVEYGAVDEHPVAGVNYYRLRQTDLDGTSTLSHVAAVELKERDGLDVTVYPNPTSGQVFIRLAGMEAGEFDVTVLDAAGRQVMQRTLVLLPNEALPLDLHGLATGIYTLRLRTGGRSEVVRIQVSG